jgi:hypothetical protein
MGLKNLCSGLTIIGASASVQRPGPKHWHLRVYSLKWPMKNNLAELNN